MIVGAWMATDLETVTPDSPIGDAAIRMTRRGIRRLPVVHHTTAGLRLVGLLTAIDLLRAFPADQNPFSLANLDKRKSLPGGLGDWSGIASTPVQSIMVTPVVTTTPDAMLTTVARTLFEKKLGALPVLRGQDLVGIITESDVFRAFAVLFQLEAGDTGLVLEAPAGPRTFATVVEAARLTKVELSALVASPTGDRTVWFARAAGLGVDAFRDQLWKSAIRVLAIQRPAG